MNSPRSKAEERRHVREEVTSKLFWNAGQVGGEAWGMLEDNLSTGDWLHPEHRDGSCSLYKEGKDLLSQGRRARGRALIYKRGQQVSKKAVPLVRGFLRYPWY